jgi:hypothetical protein
VITGEDIDDFASHDAFSATLDHPGFYSLEDPLDAAQPAKAPASRARGGGGGGGSGIDVAPPRNLGRRKRILGIPIQIRRSEQKRLAAGPPPAPEEAVYSGGARVHQQQRTELTRAEMLHNMSVLFRFMGERGVLPRFAPLRQGGSASGSTASGGRPKGGAPRKGARGGSGGGIGDIDGLDELDDDDDDDDDDEVRR